jgi:hypothetical protein
MSNDKNLPGWPDGEVVIALNLFLPLSIKFLLGFDWLIDQS